MSLRSILGGKVKKKPTRSKAPSSPRPKATAGSSSKARNASAFDEEKLDDLGLEISLATDLSLRDVPQALRYVRQSMFDPVPERASGMGSQRIAEILNFRRSLPRVASAAHVGAVLRSGTATEREIAELVRAGVLRKVLVPGRGSVGDELVEVEELVKMVEARGGVQEAAREEFVKWLKEARGQRVPRGGLDPNTADQLVRAGFFVANVLRAGGSEGLFSRPEDRTSMMSLETVARAASGSAGAVGGDGAVHAVGGSGSRGGGGEHGELSLAVPGNGAFLKLVSSALSHLTALLSKSPFREAPEDVLREKWDGGIARDEQQQHLAKKARGEFIGILPGRTKKWKEFYGLNFNWVLAEAVGAGLVELFETGSVGRGVRLT